MAKKTAKEQLCALYNAANPTLPTALTVDDFRCGSRGAYTPPEGSDSLANFALGISAVSEVAPGKTS